jgi:DNA-binding Lrp family transcriptional regulator
MTRTDLLGSNKLAVLNEMQRDCQRSRKAISREVGISEANLCKIVSDLRYTGHIRKIAAVLDRSKVGYASLAFFKVECMMQDGIDIAPKLAEMDVVLEVHRLGIDSNLLLKCIGHSPEELFQLQQKIRDFPGVRRVNVEVALSTVKESAEVPIRSKAC